ncbi:MAG: hypothetical protein PHR35_13805 [Kiritimatiellae bacterium]|nr:hypothetical protein [Kiritimatiellia bacterium]
MYTSKTRIHLWPGVLPAFLAASLLTAWSAQAANLDDDMLTPAKRTPRYTKVAAMPADDARASVDPLRMAMEMRLSNRYLGMIDGCYRNTIAGELRMPVDENWMLRGVVPFVITDQFGDNTTTGDLRLGLDRVVGRDDRQGWLIGLDAILDTSSEIPGGRGKHSVEPHVVWALYRGERTVIAPSYRHTISLSGESWRPDINEGVLALLVGWASEGGTMWTAITPEILYDVEGEAQFFSASIELGYVASRTSRLYIKPMAGFSSEDYATVGVDYPFDWGIEAGWRLTFE